MVNEFLDYLQYEKARTPVTVRDYQSRLRDFETFFKLLDAQLTWETVDTDVIRDWMAYKMEHGCQARTICSCLSAVKSLYRFALSRDLVKVDPARKVEPPKYTVPLPHFIRESEMDRLLDDVPWGESYKEVRARTIIITFYETGIRAGELIRLDDDDVDMANRQLKVTGKGNKQRYVPFGLELEKAMRRYVAVRNEQVPSRCHAFFVSPKGDRINYQAVRKDVRDHLMLVSTQKKLSPHVLRHSYATAMLNHGSGIEGIRRLLGHASASTTEIYTHTTFEQLKRVYKDAHPRA